MIKINDADGKTQETPIVITDADDDREARIFYNKYLEYYQKYHDCDRYEAEEVGDTMDQLLAVHRFYRNDVYVTELWIDYTIFFHKYYK